MKLKNIASMALKGPIIVSLSTGLLLAASDPTEPKAGAVHSWEYSGEIGPEHWGELDPAFASCSQGESQSPIDIVSREAAERFGGTMQTFYGPTGLKILNNGHTIEVEYEPGSFIQLGARRYDLLQFHFHSPSEHTVEGGAQFPIEMHLVHRAGNGQLAVIGVLIRQGAENQALAKVWEHLPSEIDEEEFHDIEFEIDEVLPEDRRAYHYSGSLTTPPCSEGVRWMVLRKAIEMSAEQIAAFQSALGESCCGFNNRPVQPLNDRQFGLDIY